MPDLQDINEFNNQLVNEYKPHKVILFGSHARGTPGPDSDVDILVILSFKEKDWGQPTRLKWLRNY